MEAKWKRMAVVQDGAGVGLSCTTAIVDEI